MYSPTYRPTHALMRKLGDLMILGRIDSPKQLFINALVRRLSDSMVDLLTYLRIR